MPWEVRRAHFENLCSPMQTLKEAKCRLLARDIRPQPCVLSPKTALALKVRSLYVARSAFVHV